MGFFDDKKFSNAYMMVRRATFQWHLNEAKCNKNAGKFLKLHCENEVEYISISYMKCDLNFLLLLMYKYAINDMKLI